MKKLYSIVVAILMFFNLSSFAQDSPPWDFNGTDHGFVAQNYASLTVGDTYVTFTLNDADGDGDAESPNSNFRNLDAGIDTSLGGFIAITMKNETANNKMQAILGSPGGSCGCYVNFETLSANDADFVTHYINVGANSNWTGTLSEIIFRFKKGNGVNNQTFAGDILIDHIEIVESIPATPRVDYTFDDTSDSEGFSAVNGVTLTQPVAGELHLDIAAQSPYPKLEQTGLYSVDADTYKYVQVTLVNNSPKNKLTLVSPSGGNEYSTVDMVANDGVVQTYELDLTALTNWNGTQANWWFQLVENPGDGPVASAGIIDIQQILFVEESSQPSSVTGPWCQDFETTVPPDGWASFRGENGLGTSYDWTTSTIANGGAQAAYVRYENVSGGNAEDWLVTPQFTPNATDANRIKFFHRQAYGSNYGATYAVKVSTASQTTHADFTDIASWTEADFTTSYEELVIDLSSYVDTPIYVAFVMTNDDGDNWYVDDVCVDAAPTEPLMSVTASTDGGSATFSFDIQNFTVGASGDTGVDGHIHYSLNGGSEVMVYSSDDLTLTDLPNGDHTIVFSLVDESHQQLDPAVTATVEFSTFDGTAACGDTVTYTQVNGNTYTLTVTAPDGQNVSVTVNGQLESNWDDMVITDSAGNQVNTQIDGVFTDAVFESDGTMTITVTNDSSVNYGDLTFAFTCAAAQANVTFTVNTANITVGENGMYLGGGVFGGATAHAMSDADGDGTWEVTVAMDLGTTGNYIFLNLSLIHI